MDREELRVSEHDREVALSILDMHAARVKGAKDDAARKVLGRRLLKPLWDRRAARVPVEGLEVPAAQMSPVTGVGQFLRIGAGERTRDIRKCKRLTEGLLWWLVMWLTGPGVVCYERTAAHIQDECARVATEDMVRRLVKVDSLPTAVASASDHYVVLEPGKAPRFMSVQEVGQTLGVPEWSALMRMLAAPAVLTANQAVSCLGRSVHMGVARPVL